MNTNVIVRALLVTLCLGAGAMGTSVAVGAGMESDVAPPAPRDERAPAPFDKMILCSLAFAQCGSAWLRSRSIIQTTSSN